MKQRQKVVKDTEKRANEEAKFKDSIAKLEKLGMMRNARFMRFVYEKWKSGTILSDKELADSIPIAKSAISGIRNGTQDPSKVVLRKMEDLYGLSLGFINSGEEPMEIVPRLPKNDKVHHGDRALLLTFYDHLIKLESKVYEKDVQDLIAEFGADTRLKEKAIQDEF